MRRVRSAIAAVLLPILVFGCTRDPSAPPAETEVADVVVAPARGDEAGAPAPPADEDAPDAARADKTTLRIMSFNVKHGDVVDHDFAKLVAPILPSKPDVLALQEIDDGTGRSHGLHETEEIAKHMNMPHAYFGANFAYDGGSYGLAIVSRYPLSRTRVIRLDDHTSRGNGYEPRIAVAADVAVGARFITVVSVHASLRAEERAGNAARILAALGAGASRAIVMGDMNETPGGPIEDAFVSAGFADAFHERHPTANGFTSPASPAPLRRIDYLFKGASFGATAHAWVPDVTTSDHRPVAAVVALPN